jgi:hypothetical protein
MTQDHKLVLSVRNTLGTLATRAIILTTGSGAVGAQTLDLGIVPHQELSAYLETVPHPDLKTVYLHCSREAPRGTLGFGGIASCSVVYETLLKRIFGGDFHSLIAWSRAQRDDTIAQDSGEMRSVENAESRWH